MVKTAFLDEEYPKGYSGLLKSKDKILLISMASLAMKAIEIKRESELNKGTTFYFTLKK